MKDTYGVELDLIIGRFKSKMNEIKDMMSLVKNKYEIEIDPSFDLDKLESEFKKAFIELSKFKNIEVLSPKQAEQVALLQLYMDKLNDRMVELGGKKLKFTQLKEAKEDSKQVADNMDVISIKAKASSDGLSGTFTKATKSLKRFALSLFGIRSIWAMLSKGVRSYMNQNEKMQNTMAGIWNAFGTLMAPIAEMLANIFLKLLGYINVVTKALWGFDFIAKANANTMEAYNKKLAKTQKALFSIDEIQNINQNEQEGPQGLIDESQIKLNDKLVKKLQDLSYWLKDNWDWLSKVLIAIGAVFGISAVAGWLGNISKLLGGSGAGLIGLSGIFKTLATIGVIAIGVDLMYKALTGRDLVKDLKDIKEGLSDLHDKNNQIDKDNKKLHEDFMENANAVDKSAESYKKSSQDVALYIGKIQSVIELNQSNIRQNEEWQNSLGITGNVLSRFDGSMEAHKNSTKRSREEIERMLESYRKLYENGKLNAEQTKEYSNIMGQFGYKVDGTKMSFEEYIKFAKDSTDETKKYGNELKNVTDKNYSIKINSELEKPDTSKFRSGINDLISSMEGIFGAIGTGIGSIAIRNGTSLKKSIPKLSIGTDNVRSEGLAYLHAGEKVVPADVARGGYSGDNNNETNDLLRQLIEAVQEKEFSASISANDVGRASVNYIRNQNRIMGGSVI